MAKILVVDDDQQIRDILKLFLTTEGYEVVTASCGEEALIIMDKTTPDLITLDISMPGINGYEVCRKIRTEYSQKALPIIMVSGNRHPQDEIKAFDVGADEYIKKPFQNDELLSTIKTLFGRNKETP